MGRGHRAPAALWAVCLLLLAAGTQALGFRAYSTFPTLSPGALPATITCILTAAANGALARAAASTAATAITGLPFSRMARALLQSAPSGPLPPNTTTGTSPSGVPFTYAPDILNAGNPIPDPNPFYLGIVRPLGSGVVLPRTPNPGLKGGAAALAAAAAAGRFSAGGGSAPKPVDGKNDDDDLKKLPYGAIGQLSLNGGASFCTATLIHKQYVLTTASCLNNPAYNASVDSGCCASDPTSDCCWSAQPFLPIGGFSLQMNARADGKGSVKRPFGMVGVSLIRWKGPETPYMPSNIVGNGFRSAPSDYALLQLAKPLPSAPILPMDAECTGRYSLTIAGYGLGQNPKPSNATMYQTTCNVEDLNCYGDYVIPLEACNLGQLGLDAAPVLVRKKQKDGSSSWAMRGMVRSWCDTATGACSKEAYELTPQDVYSLMTRANTAPLDSSAFLCPS